VRAVAIRRVSGAVPAIARGASAAGVAVVAERDGTRLAQGLREAGVDLN